MLGHFQVLLEGVIADPSQKIGELPLLTEAERTQALVKWNHTRTNYPREKTVAQLFEEQVAQSPDATALIFEDKHLTYRELNERANQLAHHLKKFGVAPNV